MTINPEYKGIVSNKLPNNLYQVSSFVNINDPSENIDKVIYIKLNNNNEYPIKVYDTVIFAKNKLPLIENDSIIPYNKYTINSLEPYFSISFFEEKDIHSFMDHIYDTSPIKINRKTLSREDITDSLSILFNHLSNTKKELEKTYKRPFSYIEVVNNNINEFLENDINNFYNFYFNGVLTKTFKKIFYKKHQPIFKNFYVHFIKKIYIRSLTLIGLNEYDIKEYLKRLNDLFKCDTRVKCSCKASDSLDSWSNTNLLWCIFCDKKNMIENISKIIKINPYLFLSNETLANKIFINTHYKDYPSDLIENIKMYSKLYKKCISSNTFCIKEDDIEKYDESILNKTYNIHILNGCLYLKYRLDFEKNICHEIILRTVRKNDTPIDIENLNADSLTKSGLLVITGGPGTGKTTLIKKIEEVMLSQKKKGLFTSFTGKAVCKLQENVKGKDDCYTINYLLEKSDEVISPDYIVIDEMSMVSPVLFYTFLKRYPTKLLILVGDVDQLYPIEWGNVFSPIIEILELKYPNNLIRLTVNHRQSNEKLKSVISRFKSNGFFSLNTKHIEYYKDNDQLKKLLLQYSSDTSTQYTFMSPYKKTCELVNEVFSKKFAKGEKVILNENIYIKKENDKVILIPNGTIGEIKRKKKSVMVNDIEVDLEDYSFELCYCLTIHKMQGSECDNLVLIIPNISKSFISKSLFYTAISRPKNKLKILTNIYNIKDFIKENVFKNDDMQSLNNFGRYFGM